MMPLPNRDSLPDFKFINRIPIVAVAEKIGLEIRDDGSIVCPRHEEGSLEILKVLSGNKVKCSGCRTGPLGVVDLLMHIGGFPSPLDGVQCFKAELASFNTPRIAKGSHLNNPDCLDVPPACEDPIQLLVLSGVWATLSPNAQRLAPALLVLSRWKSEGGPIPFRLSFIAMKRYSGIVSPNAINAGLEDLEGIGWLKRLGSARRGDSPIKNTGEYTLTPLSQEVRDLADATAPGFGAEIQTEKAARQRKRQVREQSLKPKWPSS